jgi:hypothetical protein
MRINGKWAIAMLMVTGAVLLGCDPAGGGDPRAAPGCVLNARRCDGDILQICQINAAERRKTWWDVHDCVKFGNEIGTALSCMERAAETAAECAESKQEAGIDVDGGAAGARTDCSLGAWRCHDGVAQACGPGAESPGAVWWDVWDCDEQMEQLGRPMACVEWDAGTSASCEYLRQDGGVAVVDPWQ